MRRHLIVANWKMHKTAVEAAAYVRRLAPLVRQAAHTEIVLAPPFTALSVASVPAGRRFAFAAQNLHWEDAGAFTGEVSARMLVALGCTYVIVGHSERRRLCGEDDSVINKKILAATGHGLRPILCIGESPAERRQGQTTRVVTRQLQKGLRGITSQDARLLTIAYEPVWAIGTGIAASPEHIHAVHLTIRACLVKKWGARVANRMRILYGGSVNPDNVVAFVQSPEVDGVLVGGACLDPRTFAKIVRRC
ncbi:MAG: triose-phosphate isomerase [Nitrospira sp.]